MPLSHDQIAMFQILFTENGYPVNMAKRKAESLSPGRYVALFLQDNGYLALEAILQDNVWSLGEDKFYSIIAEFQAYELDRAQHGD